MWRVWVVGNAGSGKSSWIVDGNYSEVSDLVLARADTVIWIDLPRASVMRQLAGRTLRRGLLRQELWNGNRESLRGIVSRDPEKSIMLWARRHATYSIETALDERLSIIDRPAGSLVGGGRDD